MWRGCAIIAYGASSFLYTLLPVVIRVQWKHGDGLNAKLYVGRCKALRRQMQSFAWTVAKLCVGRCNALREIGNVGTEIVSPILDKIKGEKTHHTDC